MKNRIQLLKKIACAAGIALMVGSATTASADIITWQPSVDLIAGGDNGNFVDNSTGNLVLAFNGTSGADGSTSTTVNGVAFQNVNVDALNGGAVTGAGGVGVSSTYVSGRDTPTAFGRGSFANNDTVDSLIEGAVFGGGTDAPAAPSITFTGLTPGDQYVIQILANDARTNGGRGPNWQLGLSDGVNNDIGGGDDTNVAIANLNNGASDRSGDFIIGTFTADASATQTFALDATRNGFTTFSTGQAQINALQLRVIPAVVPEPSSLALLGLGSLLLVSRRRRD